MRVCFFFDKECSLSFPLLPPPPPLPPYLSLPPSLPPSSSQPYSALPSQFPGLGQQVKSHSLDDPLNHPRQKQGRTVQEAPIPLRYRWVWKCHLSTWLLVMKTYLGFSVCSLETCSCTHVVFSCIANSRESRDPKYSGPSHIRTSFIRIP